MGFDLRIRTFLRLAHRLGFSLPSVAAATIFLALSQTISLAPALAGVEAGVTAYARGDLPTAFREFPVSAREGDNEARYRLAAMYANGEGTPSNDLLAYKWLTCVAGRDVGKWLMVKADVRRFLIGLFNDEVKQNATALARRDCRIGSLTSAERRSVENHMVRANWLADLLLYPGDLVVLLLMALGEFFALGWLVTLMANLIKIAGDIFPAIIAVIVWSLVWRVCFAMFEMTSSGFAGRSLADQGRVRFGFWRRRNEDEIVRKPPPEKEDSYIFRPLL